MDFEGKERFKCFHSASVCRFCNLASHEFVLGRGCHACELGAVIFTFHWIPFLIIEMEFRRWATGILGLSFRVLEFR